ncbi:glycosyltransferase [Candidatus Omnitrophota bacterium]
MKIFILYASAGAGHRRAAEAIYDYFGSQDPDLQLKLVDSLEFAHPIFRIGYASGYSFLVSHLPHLWSLFFKFTCLHLPRSFVESVRSIVNRMSAQCLIRLLIRENPDCIISTHFLPSKVAAYLKRKSLIRSKLFTVITDYILHPFWLAEGTDTYIVPCSLTKDELRLAGVKNEMVKDIGIPIDIKFSKQYQKDEVRARLGLKKKKFSVLISTSAFGIGPIEKLVEALHRDVQLMVVCGRNTQLFSRLDELEYSNVRLFTFVDNIEELMAASDLVITKPGGLTISELLAMELPPIFVSVIPGQEEDNLRALKNYGVGIKEKDPQRVSNIVLEYRSSLEKLNRAKEDLSRIKKPFAVRELYNVVCQSSPRASG